MSMYCTQEYIPIAKPKPCQVESTNVTSGSQKHERLRHVCGNVRSLNFYQYNSLLSVGETGFGVNNNTYNPVMHVVFVTMTDDEEMSKKGILKPVDLSMARNLHSF
jgi:hypothetical protein